MFFEDFDDGVFQQAFDAAFFERGHGNKLKQLSGPVNRSQAASCRQNHFAMVAKRPGVRRTMVSLARILIDRAN